MDAHPLHKFATFTCRMLGRNASCLGTAAGLGAIQSSRFPGQFASLYGEFIIAKPLGLGSAAWRHTTHSYPQQQQDEVHLQLQL